MPILLCLKENKEYIFNKNILKNETIGAAQLNYIV